MFFGKKNQVIPAAEEDLTPKDMRFIDFLVTLHKKGRLDDATEKLVEDYWESKLSGKNLVAKTACQFHAWA